MLKALCGYNYRELFLITNLFLKKCRRTKFTREYSHYYFSIIIIHYVKCCSIFAVF